MWEARSVKKRKSKSEMNAGVGGGRKEKGKQRKTWGRYLGPQERHDQTANMLPATSPLPAFVTREDAKLVGEIGSMSTGCMSLSTGFNCVRWGARPPSSSSYAHLLHNRAAFHKHCFIAMLQQIQRLKTTHSTTTTPSPALDGSSSSPSSARRSSGFMNTTS